MSCGFWIMAKNMSKLMFWTFPRPRKNKTKQNKNKTKQKHENEAKMKVTMIILGISSIANFYISDIFSSHNI